MDTAPASQALLASLGACSAGGPAVTAPHPAQPGTRHASAATAIMAVTVAARLSAP